MVLNHECIVYCCSFCISFSVVVIIIVVLFQEVFRSDFYDSVPFDKVLGKCYVMYVKEYFKMKPEVSLALYLIFHLRKGLKILF